MIGQIVSHYRIIEKLGEGGMGVVYRARDTNLDRDVAIKFLPHALTTDPTEKERFTREAKTAAALTHANIAVVHEIGETSDGQLFLAMECVEGKTLRQVISHRTLSMKQALEVAVQIAEGLSAAHRKGIVHRDVKPENIMLTDEGGTVKITDFGLAKLAGATSLTQSGSTVGTAAYMSPEQARGEEVDQRSDIFSLGVVLYEMLAGRPPFRGDHVAALVFLIVNEEPPPLARDNEQVSPELGHIVSKALEKDRGERYQRADDLLADLRKELRKLEHPQSGSATTGDATPPARPGAATSASKRRWTLLALGAALAAVLAFIAINFFVPGSAPVPPRAKSIAVLPFKNMSDSKEDEYFSDGLTEDIITQLSRISGLEKVIARTSVMQYKNTTKSVRDIGKELNVATVLEGSVRHSGKQVRIVAQLIDTKTEGHLWADTYDRDMAGIFAIQSDVAQQIAAVLKAALLPEEKTVLEKRPTANLTAYDYYLRGREYYYRYVKQDNETAIGLFRKAIGLDSGYVLAYAGLADAYAQRRGNFGMGEEWLDSALAVAASAVDRDGTCAEAHKALGLAYEFKGFYRKAVDANRKALQFNPNFAPAVANIGDELAMLGNIVEGIKWRKKALQLDPTRSMNYFQVAMYYDWLTDDENADKYYRQALELQPDNPAAYIRMSGWHFDQGRFEEEARDIEKAFSFDHDTARYNDQQFWLAWCRGDSAGAKALAQQQAARGDSGALARIYWWEGKREEARDILTKANVALRNTIDGGDGNFMPRYALSSSHAVLEERSESLRWLRRAVDAGLRNYRLVMLDPDMRSVRDSEEFKRIVAEMKADVEDQKRRVQEMEKTEGR